jgi:hypothetical protein
VRPQRNARLLDQKGKRAYRTLSLSTILTNGVPKGGERFWAQCLLGVFAPEGAALAPHSADELWRALSETPNSRFNTDDFEHTARSLELPPLHYRFELCRQRVGPQGNAYLFGHFKLDHLSPSFSTIDLGYGMFGRTGHALGAAISNNTAFSIICASYVTKPFSDEIGAETLPIFNSKAAKRVSSALSPEPDEIPHFPSTFGSRYVP